MIWPGKCALTSLDKLSFYELLNADDEFGLLGSYAVRIEHDTRGFEISWTPFAVVGVSADFI